MNIVFFGSSNFGLLSLEMLLKENHKVLSVITQPDKKKGRGLSISSTPIKDYAIKNKLRLYQPEQINSIDSVNFLKNLQVDLFVVIAYGQILSKEVLNIPSLMPINLHASILPAYRGAAPINWAIINEEKKTGITAIKMIEQLDAGPIIFIEEIPIEDNDTAITLENKLSILSAQCLKQSIELIIKGEHQLLSQDINKVSFAPKLKKDDGLINWECQASQIHNLVKGCLGWPNAFTYLGSKLLKIFKTEIIRENYPESKLNPGEITHISKDGILVATGKDKILIKELQLEGKRKMQTEEFISGQKIAPGTILGAKMI
ncbi:MAG: methionyl-tRNA formyltransferase [Candidatus Omnitrophota bacterium]